MLSQGSSTMHVAIVKPMNTKKQAFSNNGRSANDHRRSQTFFIVCALVLWYKISKKTFQIPL